MENDRIIIILLAIIVVMLIVGLLMFMPSIFGQDTNIVINSMDSIDTGGQFTLQLTDKNGNPIINQEIDVTFKTANGVSSTKNVVTDSSGMGYVQLGDLSAGEYDVDCEFKGNSAYKSSSASKHISVNTAQVTADSTNPSDSSGLSEDGYSYYPEYGPAVDSAGITREYAIANNWHYISMVIDGETVGGYVPYDSKAGCYHT